MPVCISFRFKWCFSKIVLLTVIYLSICNYHIPSHYAIDIYSIDCFHDESCFCFGIKQDFSCLHHTRWRDRDLYVTSQPVLTAHPSAHPCTNKCSFLMGDEFYSYQLAK